MEIGEALMPVDEWETVSDEDEWVTISDFGMDPPTSRPDKAPPRSGDYHYDVPLPDPGVVAATAPIALAPAGIGALAGLPARAAATTVGKVAGEVGAGYLADKGLAAVGVPSEIRAALFGMYGMGRMGGSTIGRRVGAAMRGKPAPAAAPPTSVPRGASTTGTPSAATIPNVSMSSGSAPVVAKAAPAVAEASAAAVVPEAAVFHGDKVWRVGERIFNNPKDALQFSHSLKRTGTASKVVAQTVPAVEKAADAIVLRRPGYRVAEDSVNALTKPGNAYRGMTAAEYEATVGAGKGMKSTGAYSVKGEGTSLADNAADAESYVNFGRTDPRLTGQPTYIVEVAGKDGMTQTADGYLKAAGAISQDRISRVWQVVNEGGALVAKTIVPNAAKVVTNTPAAVTRHAALVQFAKDAAAKNPKLGEKIWIVLDKAGNPAKIVTSDQAGAAKRAGLDTTWVKNLWK